MGDKTGDKAKSSLAVLCDPEDVFIAVKSGTIPQRIYHLC